VNLSVLATFFHAIFLGVFRVIRYLLSRNTLASVLLPDPFRHFKDVLTEIPTSHGPKAGSCQTVDEPHTENLANVCRTIEGIRLNPHGTVEIAAWVWPLRRAQLFGRTVH
jgi:hypothetical protein